MRIRVFSITSTLLALFQRNKIKKKSLKEHIKKPYSSISKKARYAFLILLCMVFLQDKKITKLKTKNGNNSR